MIKIRGRTKKEKAKQLVALLLSAVMLISCAFAYLTATDSKTNKFTMGNVEVELWENFDTNKDGSISENEVFGPEAEPEDTLVDNIVPSQQVIKAPWIENTGDTPAYVYMMVGIPKDTYSYANDEGIPYWDGDEVYREVFSILGLNCGPEDNKWTLIDSRSDMSPEWIPVGTNVTENAAAADNEFNYYVFAYNSILDNIDNEETQEQENVTSVLFTDVLFDNLVANDGNVGEKFGPYAIPIYAYAIQSQNSGAYSTPVEAWNMLSSKYSNLYPDSIRRDQYVVTFKSGDEKVGETYYGTRRTFDVDTVVNYPSLDTNDGDSVVWIDFETGKFNVPGVNTTVRDVLSYENGEVVNYWPTLRGFIKDDTLSGISNITIGDTVFEKGNYVAPLTVIAAKEANSVSVYIERSAENRSGLSGYTDFTLQNVSDTYQVFATNEDTAFVSDNYSFVGKEDRGDSFAYRFNIVCGSVNDESGSASISSSFATLTNNDKNYCTEFYDFSDQHADFEREYDNEIISAKLLGLTGLPIGAYCNSATKMWEMTNGGWGRGYTIEVITDMGVNMLRVVAMKYDEAADRYSQTIDLFGSDSMTGVTTLDGKEVKVWRISVENAWGDVKASDVSSRLKDSHNVYSRAVSGGGLYFNISAIHTDAASLNGYFSESYSYISNPESPVNILTYYVPVDTTFYTFAEGADETVVDIYIDPDINSHRQYVITKQLEE